MCPEEVSIKDWKNGIRHAQRVDVRLLLVVVVCDAGEMAVEER